MSDEKKPDDGLHPPWRGPTEEPPDPNAQYFAPGRDALEREQAMVALGGGPTEKELLQAERDLESVQGEIGPAYFGSLGGEPGVSQKELKNLRQEIEALKRRVR